jgi:hypothetical protein
LPLTHHRTFLCVEAPGVLEYEPHVFGKVQRTFVVATQKLFLDCLKVHWSVNDLKIVCERIRTFTNMSRLAILTVNSPGWATQSTGSLKGSESVWFQIICSNSLHCIRQSPLDGTKRRDLEIKIGFDEIRRRQKMSSLTFLSHSHVMSMDPLC